MQSNIVSNLTKPPLPARNDRSKRRLLANKSLIHFKPYEARSNKNTPNDRSITGIYNASHGTTFWSKRNII
jgi:hypothetical protein